MVEEIEAIECSKSYGNPSGHSSYFTSVFPCIILILVEYMLRLTVDQIVYGSLIGLVIFFYFYFIARSPINLYFRQFFDDKVQPLSFWLNLQIFFVVFCTSAFIAIIIYLINVMTFTTPQEWIDVIVSKCNADESSLLGHKAPQNIGISHSIFNIGVLGSLIGILLYSLIIKMPVDKMDFLPFWKTYKIFDFFTKLRFEYLRLRILINALMSTPALILLTVPADSPFVIVVIVTCFLPIFIFSFLIFGVNRFVLYITNLTKTPQRVQPEPRENTEEQKKESDKLLV